MNVMIFLLLSIICIGLIFIIHKYFGKEELYFLAIIYAIVALMMSFKTIKIFGIDINASIIFDSGIIFILYYFIRKYKYNESKKLMLSILICMLITSMFLITTSIMIPSLYDEFNFSYQNMVLDNLPTIIIYPLSLLITMSLSSYCFRQLKEEEDYRLIKTILTIIGITFIEVLIFIYFSYAFMIGSKKALIISLNSYLAKVILMIIFTIFLNIIFKVKKVKE